MNTPFTNKTLNRNRWIDFYFKLENQWLSQDQIHFALNDLFSLFNKLALNTIILIQFKIKYDGNQFRSISYLQTIKLSEFSELLEIFTEFWSIRDQDYLSLSPSHIVFTYKVLEMNTIITKSKINKSKLIIDTKNLFNFKGYNLPATMDFTLWGSVINYSDRNVEVRKHNSNSIYHIELLDNELLVDLKMKNKTVLFFKDKMIEKGKLDSFIRRIKNQEYIFIDGKCVIKKIVKETNFLQPIIQHSFISSNFLTMDLETRTIDGIMTPYALSIYDGKITFPFYLDKFNNSDDLLKSAIRLIMIPKYHNYKVYLHNFSFFDSIFILKILSELTDITIRPIFRDGRIIDLKFPFFVNNRKLYLFFRDSYLLLPASLSNLALNFNVSKKGIFPYQFVNNKNIPLNYNGLVPSYEYFNNLSIEEYQEYCFNFKTFEGQRKSWDLKKETIKYCNQDVITLYEIIEIFQRKIFSLFRLDILKYPTLSSLAFAIYRSNFLKNFKIPLIEGDLFNQLKKGYTGGSVDVYKPQPEPNEKVYRYDVNSLYPSVMKQNEMPIGNPIYFEGDINLIKEDTGYNLIKKPFGFFEVKVTAPDYYKDKPMKIPILQTRIKTKNGLRTVAPLGTWTGIYFSEEINNALKYGYKFQILRGYLFEKQKIFSEYVDLLFNMKVNSKSGTPDYIISKLLLNTLYGRFGMDPQMENHLILNSEKSLLIQNEKIVTNVIDLQNGKELISFFDEHNWSEEKEKKTLNISVAISAAITAAGRIYMSQFKLMDDITLFYSDTDNIDINKPLPDQYIGKELGKMKLEHIFNHSIFLAPKVYGAKTDNYEYVKIKGLKNPITFDELRNMLIKDETLKIKQEKWYRDISLGHIKIKEEIYTLMINNHKRKLIYDENNKFIDTAPIYLNEGDLSIN